MNIVVCLKYISSIMKYQAENFPFSSCDKNALGMALSIKKELSSGENINIDAVCMGPLKAGEAIRDLYSFGIRNAYLISDNCYAGSDTLATTYVLANAIKKIDLLEKVDLVLCGKSTIDSNTGQIGPGLAYRLDAEYFDLLQNIFMSDGMLTFETEKYLEHSTGKLVLASVEKKFPLPFPSINNIILARNKKLILWDNNELKLDVGRVGLSGSPTKIIKTVEKYPVTAKRTCIEGDLKIKADFLDEIIKSKGKYKVNG